jgi:hypothetical protein
MAEILGWFEKLIFKKLRFFKNSSMFCTFVVLNSTEISKKSDLENIQKWWHSVRGGFSTLYFQKIV